jgi:hypothetical protein
LKEPLADLRIIRHASEPLAIASVIDAFFVCGHGANPVERENTEV